MRTIDVPRRVPTLCCVCWCHRLTYLTGEGLRAARTRSSKSTMPESSRDKPRSMYTTPAAGEESEHDERDPRAERKRGHRAVNNEFPRRDVRAARAATELGGPLED